MYSSEPAKRSFYFSCILIIFSQLFIASVTKSEPCESIEYPCQPGTTYGDPENCDKYYECSEDGSQITSQQCDINKQFDATSKQCGDNAACTPPCEPPPSGGSSDVTTGDNDELGGNQPDIEPKDPKIFDQPVDEPIDIEPAAADESVNEPAIDEPDKDLDVWDSSDTGDDKDDGAVLPSNAIGDPDVEDDPNNANDPVQPVDEDPDLDQVTSESAGLDPVDPVAFVPVDPDAIAPVPVDEVGASEVGAADGNADGPVDNADAADNPNVPDEGDTGVTTAPLVPLADADVDAANAPEDVAVEDPIVPDSVPADNEQPIDVPDEVPATADENPDAIPDEDKPNESDGTNPAGDTGVGEIEEDGAASQPGAIVEKESPDDEVSPPKDENAPPPEDDVTIPEVAIVPDEPDIVPDMADNFPEENVIVPEEADNVGDAVKPNEDDPDDGVGVGVVVPDNEDPPYQVVTPGPKEKNNSSESIQPSGIGRKDIIIIAGVLTGVIVIIVIIVLVVCLRKRRRSKKKKVPTATLR